MFKTYKYLFYKLYSWAERLHGNMDSPEYTAFFSLAFLIYANLFSILLALKLIFNFSISHIEITKVEIGLYSLIPVIPQYFLLLHKKKYLKIVNEFNGEDKKAIARGTLYTWLYILATIFILFGLVYIQMIINRTNV